MKSKTNYYRIEGFNGDEWQPINNGETYADEESDKIMAQARKDYPGIKFWFVCQSE
jgi:hypothetical protein